MIHGRGLLPPEPLELTLAALDVLRHGDQFRLLLHCEPHSLYDILQRSGFLDGARTLPDGSREITISHAIRLPTVER